jgi:predicted RNase H-like HicB family nuclease
MNSKSQTNRITKLEVIIEKENDHYWGRIEDKGNFMPTGQGKTINKLLQNVKDSIEDYIEHEGRKDKYWSKIKLDQVEFDIRYDVQSLFDEFNELKISSIAERAELNPSLMRQYASGTKFPSADQAKKIEIALHQLGSRLSQIAIYT